MNFSPHSLKSDKFNPWESVFSNATGINISIIAKREKHLWKSLMKLMCRLRRIWVTTIRIGVMKWKVRESFSMSSKLSKSKPTLWTNLKVTPTLKPSREIASSWQSRKSSMIVRLLIHSILLTLRHRKAIWESCILKKIAGKVRKSQGLVLELRTKLQHPPAKMSSPAAQVRQST